MATIKVSKNLFSKYKTINSAIAAASDNDIIKVGPGTYEEEVKLTKNLKIIGAGRDREIETIIEGQMYLQANVELENFIIEPGKNNAEYGIKVVGKKAIIKNCSVLNMKKSGIFVGRAGELYLKRSYANENFIGITIYGKTVLENCVFSNSQKFGLYVENQTAEIIDCDFFDHRYPQLLIENSQVTMSRTNIANGGSVGIKIINSKVFVEDCEISQHRGNQILVDRNSNVELVGGRVYSGESRGVIVKGSSLMFIKECLVYENEKAQIEISEKSTGTLLDCKIYNGKSSGLTFTEESKGTVEKCSVFGHGDSSPQILIKTGSYPTIKNTQIYYGHSWGIWITERSQGVIKKCDFFKNAGEYQIYIDGKSTPVITNSTIKDGKQYGIYVSDCSPLIEKCFVTGHSKQDVYYFGTKTENYTKEYKRNRDNYENRDIKKIEQKEPNQEKIITKYEKFFGFDPDKLNEKELKTKLMEEQKKWMNRTNAPSLDKRQEAERTLKLLEDIEEELFSH